MIKIAVNAGEYDGISILDKREELKRFTGNEIEVEELPIEVYHQKIMSGIKHKTPAFDVCAYAPLWAQSLAQKKHLFDLNKYMREEKMTWAETKEGLEGDFFEAYINYCGWHDMDRGVPGRSAHESLVALPGTHTGATFLVYRKDIFEKYGLQEPADWNEFQQLALEYSDISHGLYGTGIAGRRNGLFPVLDWYTRVVSTGGRQFTGTIAERNLTSNAYSPEGVKAYEQISGLFSCMPSNTDRLTVLDLAREMCEGKLLMLLYVSSFVFPQIFYNQDNKISSEKLGICQVPGIGKYRGTAYGGGWSWSILGGARYKELSWQVIQYLSSREFDQFRCIKYGVTPVRRSTLRNHNVQKAQPWVKYMERIIEKAVEPEYFYIPEAFKIAKIITDTLLKGLFEGEKAGSVLRDMDEMVNQVLKEGGWR